MHNILLSTLKTTVVRSAVQVILLVPVVLRRLAGGTASTAPAPGSLRLREPMRGGGGGIKLKLKVDTNGT